LLSTTYCLPATASYSVTEFSTATQSMNVPCTGTLRVDIKYGAFGGPPLLNLSVVPADGSAALDTAVAAPGTLSVSRLSADEGTIFIRNYFRHCGGYPPSIHYAGLTTQSIVTVPITLNCTD
jgi:hypothetical protein